MFLSATSRPWLVFLVLCLETVLAVQLPTPSVQTPSRRPERRLPSLLGNHQLKVLMYDVQKPVKQVEVYSNADLYKIGSFPLLTANINKTLYKTRLPAIEITSVSPQWDALDASALAGYLLALWEAAGMKIGDLRAVSWQDVSKHATAEADVERVRNSLARRTLTTFWIQTPHPGQRLSKRDVRVWTTLSQTLVYNTTSLLAKAAGRYVAGTWVKHKRQKKPTPFMMDTLEMPFEENRSPEDQECPVCMEDLPHHKASTIEPCGHQFHEHCIDTWKEKSPGTARCPVCRGPIKDVTRDRRRIIWEDLGFWHEFCEACAGV